ncbi:MAG: hypothetical protein ACM3Y9_08485 [Ignavibacteria bacterium]
MRSPLLAACLVLGLAACEPVAPLTNQEKVKFVFELIEDAHRCDSFRTRLEAPGIDGPAIDAIYREAIKGGCVKRDV